MRPKTCVLKASILRMNIQFGGSTSPRTTPTTRLAAQSSTSRVNYMTDK